MTLSDLAALGSFVSGLAVLVSLVFLYFQLRQLNAQVKQSEVSQQALVKQARTTRVMEINARLTSDSFAEVSLRIDQNAADLTILDVMRFAAHARTVFQNGEDSFAQYRRGLLTEADLVSFSSAMRWGFRSPPLRVAWKRHRAMFDGPYVAFVDKLVSEAEVLLPSADALEQWKAAVSAERPAATGETAAPKSRPPSAGRRIRKSGVSSSAAEAGVSIPGRT